MFIIALTTGFSWWKETRKTVLNRFNGLIEPLRTQRSTKKIGFQEIRNLAFLRALRG